MRAKKNNLKAIMFSEISLLLLSVFAFGFLISEAGIVRGQIADPADIISGAAKSPAVQPAETVNLLRDFSSHQFNLGPGKGSVAGLLSPDKASGYIEGTGVVKWNEGKGIWEAASATGGGGAQATTGVAPSLKGFLGGTGFGTQSTAAIWTSALSSGLLWGAAIGFAAFGLSKMFGLSSSQAKSVGLSVGTGVFVGSSVYFLGSNYAATGTGTLFTANGALGLTPGMWGIGLGLGVGVGVLLATYKKEKKELVKFECLPWEAPIGGGRCEECNKDSTRPCSEYRCKSLGQACELVNKGSENELCVWVNKDDTLSPIITPWDDVLKPAGLRYVPDNTIRPPNTGVKIARLGAKNGCLQAFTKLEFGITTNEPSQCRIDYELTQKLDDMKYLFGESNLYSYNHTQRLKVPNPFAEEGDAVPEIHNDGTYTLWTRCRDANGNENVDAFAFRFCVDKGPDTFAPIVQGTSIESGSAVQFDADRVPIEVYVDEPAECKWSPIDKAFDDMENTMTCARETFQINSDLNYVCSGELKGIKNRENNNFYFRCRDFSKDGRNTMSQSFPLILRGTEQLTITKVGPNGTILGSTRDSSITLMVETAHGADEGKATCYFSTEKEDSSGFSEMFGTDGFLHNQSLSLVSGNYQYFFRCIDSGGNRADASTAFTIFVDQTNAGIGRVFRDGEKLKIITNEDARCAYSLNNCNYNFEEGVALLYENPTKRNTHLADWNVNSVYYIKCEDLQGNRPAPNACSIIAKGSEF
ncbi:MAG: hypothetical protein AABX73_02535 [Nanoarchaeota archaeon]